MHPDAWKEPDCGARWVIMLSHLYYDRGVSLVEDTTFDKLCRYVADNWSDVHPTRQWQLESPEALRASGYHIKLTEMGVRAAERVWATYGPRQPLPPYSFEPVSDQPDPVHQCFFSKIRG